MTITVVWAFCPRCKTRMELEPRDVTNGGVNWDANCTECNAQGTVPAQELLFLMRTDKADPLTPAAVKEKLT